jgi:LysR family nitrogen assimilation transcriptional regulator
VETGNITKAADQLNLSQTALGIQIRNLEDQLQIELLERHSRGVKPTRAGMLLYERALDILRRIEDTQRDLISLGSETASIRLGATPSILRLIGPDIVVAAPIELPDISLHLVEQLSFVLLDALHRGELDYILGYDIPGDPALRRRGLMEEELLHIAAPGGKQEEEEISFSEAVRGDLALASNRDVIWHAVHETARRLSIDMSVAYEVQSMQGLLTLIQRGVAQSIMPYGTVAGPLQAEQVVARRIVRPTVRRTLFLASSAKHRQLPDEVPFMLFIDKMVQQLMTAIGPYAYAIERLD